MKLQFKIQPYQAKAVESVVDCFEGQPLQTGLKYAIDPGALSKGQSQRTDYADDGFKNAEIKLSAAQILANLHKIQKRQNLPLSTSLTDYYDVKAKKMPSSYNAGSDINLDIEMETGTGKTYCYIKTIFEMKKRFGWSKFIIIVPTIAIREGVHKSLEVTAEHFSGPQGYGQKIRFFTYNSKQLHKIERFSSDSGINVMIINIQAFNASGADNRRIYEELDDFQSRKPIDVISANRPILIMDEPQKMEGKATQKALPLFKPLMILRYSATHKTTHNKIHRLDALDAYNQKLVKKIAVRGIQTKGLAGTNAYMYLESIEISKKSPIARLEIEIKSTSGVITRKVIKVRKEDRLHDLSGELDQYNGFVVSNIDAVNDTIEFLNGEKVKAGEATGDVTEDMIRRIQIRDTIKTHLDKEKQLFSKGIKVLSLFFIDEVVKYRDYDAENDKGEYANIFEDEYKTLQDEVISELPEGNEYRKYLLGDINPQNTHKGYFAIDKKRKLIDPKIKTRGEEKGLANDESATAAYDLILKEKELLLSFEEPTRFIFSHSALREGWDNPNVFVICMLKHANSDNTISRRQEVGRGLRIAVNQQGERQDDPATVHDINILSVVASESFKDFVTKLQSEMSDSLSARPKKADKEYFTDKILKTPQGDIVVNTDMAEDIEYYLIQNGYVNRQKQVTDKYHQARKSDQLEALPEELMPYAQQVIELIDSVFSEAMLPEITDDRSPKTNPLNANFDKKEFQKLWNKINKKAIYQVDFDSNELVANCISVINEELYVTPLQYTVEVGEQKVHQTDEMLKQGDAFKKTDSKVFAHKVSVHSSVKYDLIGKVASDTNLTRKTVSLVLQNMNPEKFDMFKVNPEQFISECSRLINEQKATATIQHLTYDLIDEEYGVELFTGAQLKQDFTKVGEKLKKHVYDYVVTDSDKEREFVNELDISDMIEVYAKLPNGFRIPTPFGTGGYNPDWAIAFKEGSVKHILFVAETKGSMSSMQLRAIEKGKIDCARKYFERLEQDAEGDNVKFNMVASYGELLNKVS